MSVAWSIRNARPDDENEVLALLARAHADDETGTPSGEEWRWLFLENPAGRGLQYVVADAGERLAGQYATVPMRLQIRGQAAAGLLSLNTATDPDFQRQGIFTALASRLYEEAAGEFAVVYGFPNPRSAPGFYRRLDWRDLGSPRLLVRPLRAPGRSFERRRTAAALAVAAPPLNALVRLRRASSKVIPIDSFGPWADAVWARAAPALGTAAIRDAAFLTWRFDAAPRYYRRWAFIGDDGEPVGYAVSRVVEWRSESLAYLMELQAPSAHAASALLQAVVADAHSSGAIALCTVVTQRSPHRRSFAAAGLLPLPAGIARYASFGARTLGHDVPADAVLDQRAWYISPADFDWI